MALTFRPLSPLFDHLKLLPKKAILLINEVDKRWTE